MLKKIGVSLVLLMLAGCAIQEKRADYETAKANNDHLKSEAPEYQKYTVKGLGSVKCSDETQTCTMSTKDFQQNQHDKKQLLELHKGSHTKDVLQSQAHNYLVDALTNIETASTKKGRTIEYLDQAYRKERTYNSVKTWVERLSFILGVFAFGSL